VYEIFIEGGWCIGGIFGVSDDGFVGIIEVDFFNGKLFK